jgi:hypothetical protein
MNTQPMPIVPGFNAPFEEKVRWLLLNYGYCAALDRVVVLRAASGATCLWKWGAFKFAYKGWNQISQGPKGGKKITYAADIWEAHPDRLNIEDIKPRPDRPFPTYEEDGQLFKNISAEVR